MSQKTKARQKNNDPRRLEILKKFNLLDTPAEESFDRLTQLASKITNTPVSLVSLVDSDRQFFKSLWGLEGEFAEARETPLSYSFCQHVTANDEPLIVSDARQHPFLSDNLAVTELGVVSYLGMPLTTSGGTSLGSFCILDMQPREWTEQEIEIVRELALSTMSEIELMADRDAQNKARDEAEQALMARNNQYRRVYHFASSTIKNMTEIIDKGGESSEILVYLKEMERELSRL